MSKTVERILTDLACNSPQGRSSEFYQREASIALEALRRAERQPETSEIVGELHLQAARQKQQGRVGELMRRAASVITFKDQELQQLRSQLDGWRQFSRLRADVTEISELLDAVFDLNPRTKGGHPLYAALLRIRVKLIEIKEREI